MTAKRLASLAERRKRVVDALQILAAANPNPRCELYYLTPYQLLVSVVLSAQTTDKSVNRCMQPLYERGDFTPTAVNEMPENALLHHIRSIGLAPTKARNIKKLTALLLAKHHGEVPHSRQALEELPGVGRKTANVVLAEVFQEPTLAVDTHVYRVSSRLGLHRENTADKCENVLMQLVPRQYLPAAHHWFILHGRYTCKAQKPACNQCNLRSLCPSADLFDAEHNAKTTASTAPGKTPAKIRVSQAAKARLLAAVD